MPRLLLVFLVLLLAGCDEGWTEAEKFEQMGHCMKTFRARDRGNTEAERVQATCECWINKGIEAGLPPDAEPGPDINLKWDAILEACLAMHVP